MKALLFYLLLPLLYFIAILPDFILYRISDCVFFIVYHILGYRKKIVRKNLSLSFPEKSFSEKRKIEKAFYKFLCDSLFETFEMLVFSKENFSKHCALRPDAEKIFQRYYQQNQSIVVVMGHYGNWEWGGNALAIGCQQDTQIVYHPLSNPHFDRLMYKMRTRFGVKLIGMKETGKLVASVKKNLSALVLIADQAPRVENAYWTTFLNQDTPVFRGPEKICRKLNLPLVFISVHRLKRGKYEVHAETLVENPSDYAEGEITEKHCRKLEEDIHTSPEIWLWSHKRWKHKRPV